MRSITADNILRPDSFQSSLGVVLSGQCNPICNHSVRRQIGRFRIGAIQGLYGCCVTSVPYRDCYRMGIPIRRIAPLPRQSFWNYIPLDLHSTTNFEKIQYGLLNRSLVQNDCLKSADPRLLRYYPLGSLKGSTGVWILLSYISIQYYVGFVLTKF